MVIVVLILVDQDMMGQIYDDRKQIKDQYLMTWNHNRTVTSLSGNFKVTKDIEIIGSLPQVKLTEKN